MVVLIADFLTQAGSKINFLMKSMPKIIFNFQPSTNIEISKNVIIDHLSKNKKVHFYPLKFIMMRKLKNFFKRMNFMNQVI